MIYVYVYACALLPCRLLTPAPSWSRASSVTSRRPRSRPCAPPKQSAAIEASGCSWSAVRCAISCSSAKASTSILSIEAEVEPVARALAEATGGRTVLHPSFGTAKVSGRDFQLDLARTRRETYAHPGALPAVEPATLAEDLARRDFTINAIALRLAPEAGEIVDPYRGMDDIADGLLRVLHERSFQDDATRILRALRYASRLGFKLARQTEALVRRDLSYLRSLSGPRIRRDLALLFDDTGAVEGTLLGQRLGVLEAIHPALRLSDAVAGRWRDAIAGPTLAPRDELGFCLIADPRDEGTAASVSQWLHLTGRVQHALEHLVRLRERSAEVAGLRSSPVEAVDLLDHVAPAAIWALALLAAGDVAETCFAYLREWRHVRPELSGSDLLALGMAPGMQVGETLRRLRYERLDGRVTSREQEVAIVREALGG